MSANLVRVRVTIRVGVGARIRVGLGARIRAGLGVGVGLGVWPWGLGLGAWGLGLGVWGQGWGSSVRANLVTASRPAASSARLSAASSSCAILRGSWPAHP